MVKLPTNWERIIACTGDARMGVIPTVDTRWQQRACLCPPSFNWESRPLGWAHWEINPASGPSQASTYLLLPFSRKGRNNYYLHAQVVKWESDCNTALSPEPGPTWAHRGQQRLHTLDTNSPGSVGVHHSHSIWRKSARDLMVQLALHSPKQVVGWG